MTTILYFGYADYGTGFSYPKALTVMKVVLLSPESSIRKWLAYESNEGRCLLISFSILCSNAWQKKLKLSVHHPALRFEDEISGSTVTYEISIAIARKHRQEMAGIRN